MNNLASEGLAAVHDPLVITLVVFTAVGVLMHFLFRRHPVGRATVRVIFLVDPDDRPVARRDRALSAADPYRRASPRCGPCGAENRLVVVGRLVCGRPSARLCRHRASPARRAS